MAKIDSFVSQWRQALAPVRHLSPETLDELEAHLREKIERHLQDGLPEAEACDRAAAELGDSTAIAGEFRKLHPLPWLPAKLVTVVGIALAIGIALLLLVRFRPGYRGDVLLAVHVFTITIGYGATILLGVLGACFVLQRARWGFSLNRLAMLERLTLRFAVISTLCTAVGVILGMFWANREWGRYWAWDSKEIGGLCVVVWMLGFFIAHFVRRVSARGLLVASLIGSNVTLLAWFLPSMNTGLKAYGSLNATWALLPIVVILNLSLSVLGLAPSGCLRPRRA